MGLLLLALACSPPPDADLAPVAPVARLPEPVAAADLDPDPAVLEVDLVAREADVSLVSAGLTDLWVWADRSADGASVPGPLLDLGDATRLVLHLENQLLEATTLHLHGLRIPADQDGTPSSQLVIWPGESWDYVVDVVDEGLGWYHPHLSSHRQVERGLYAPIRMPGGDPLPVSADRVIVLDDLRLHEDGRFDDEWTADDLYAGRIGSTLLVNGALAGTGTILAGRRERWRLLNAAAARTFRVDLGTDALLIAHEGGTLAQPVRAREVVLAPGDRLEVLVDTEFGDRHDVTLAPYDRGLGPEPLESLALFAVVGVGGPDPGPVPARQARPPIVAPDAAMRELRFQRLTDLRYAIDGQSWPFDVHLDGVLGDRERWRLINETDQDVPFHLHGTFVQLESADGAPSWEDVVTVPPLGVTDVLVPLDAEGAWMLHTHVLEQAELGMMGMIHVEPPTAP